MIGRWTEAGLRNWLQCLPYEMLQDFETTSVNLEQVAKYALPARPEPFAAYTAEQPSQQCPQ